VYGRGVLVKFAGAVFGCGSRVISIAAEDGEGWGVEIASGDGAGAGVDIASGDGTGAGVAIGISGDLTGARGFTGRVSCRGMGVFSLEIESVRATFGGETAGEGWGVRGNGKGGLTLESLLVGIEMKFGGGKAKIVDGEKSGFMGVDCVSGAWVSLGVKVTRSRESVSLETIGGYSPG